MRSKISRKTMAAAGASLAVAGLATLAIPGSASAAATKPAIDTVPCNNSEYLQVWWHPESGTPKSNETCLANGGTYTFPTAPNGPDWLDAFSTGNNTVQYETTDGQWLPATPVGKNTYYDFPHYPGGVSFTAIRIV